MLASLTALRMKFPGDDRLIKAMCTDFTGFYF